jgi:F-type H+-transporting ATPase subunit delta
VRSKRKVRRAARHLYQLCAVGGTLNEARVRQVWQGIEDSGRRGALPILREFQRLVRIDRARYTALVESATPLEDGLRDQVQTDLARVYGPTLNVSFQENPSLIGGMRVRVGSDVYDGSVRARLAALEARF